MACVEMIKNCNIMGKIKLICKKKEESMIKMSKA